MKVKELMELLTTMDPNATVCVEANYDCLAHMVRQYDTACGKQVYIADNTDYIDCVMQMK